MTADGKDISKAPLGFGLAATGIVLIFLALSMMWLNTMLFALIITDHGPLLDVVATWTPVALLGAGSAIVILGMKNGRRRATTIASIFLCLTAFGVLVMVLDFWFFNLIWSHIS